MDDSGNITPPIASPPTRRHEQRGAVGRLVGSVTGERALMLLLAAAWLSFLPNLHLHEFKFEESLRAIVSYEMVHNGDYIQPTYLGDPYYKKPPLFNWLTITSAHILGWNELSVRAVSISAVLFTVVLLYLFALRLFGERRLALLAALIHITFFDVLFFYGFIGEIDATFSLVVFATMAAQYLGFRQQKNGLIVVAGVFASLAFMLKGLPGYAFFGVTLITLVAFYRRWRWLRSSWVLASLIAAVALPLLWLMQTPDPGAYFAMLFAESANRVEASAHTASLAQHLVMFPLENLKQFFPASVFAIPPLLALMLGKPWRILARPVAQTPPDIKGLGLLALMNYVPYLAAAGSQGRYILPLAPLLAIMFAWLLLHTATERYVRLVVVALAFSMALRWLFGVVAIPEIQARKESRRDVAMDIVNTIGNDKNIACDCRAEKTVCLYVDLYTHKTLMTSSHMSNWDYNISCASIDDARLLKTYPVGDGIRLYARTVAQP